MICHVNDENLMPIANIIAITSIGLILSQAQHVAFDVRKKQVAQIEQEEQCKKYQLRSQVCLLFFMRTMKKITGRR